VLTVLLPALHTSAEGRLSAVAWDLGKALAVLVGMIEIGKFAIWSVIVKLFGFPLRTAVLAGVGLTQIGELSYVLVKVARDERLVSAEVYNAVLAASLISILLNAALMRWTPAWLDRFGLREPTL